MRQLTPEQHGLVERLVACLSEIEGVRAVVLGGSHARGSARPESDIDLGILYSDAEPFAIRSICELAAIVNDTPRPVVTGFYEWGPWVNGGAWLTIGGQRVDFIYRSLEHIDRVISEAEAGRYELHYAQQPPFGFFSAIYLGEVSVCVPLFDPEARLGTLKQRVGHYPEALRQAVVRDYLWMAEFGLNAFARKFAIRADSYGTAACLTRAINEMVLALFALNRVYPLNDKTFLQEIAGFECAPCEFGPRARQTLEALGASAPEQLAAVDSITRLLRESIDLSEGLYEPRFPLP